MKYIALLIGFTLALLGCAGRTGLVRVADVDMSTITWVNQTPLQCGDMVTGSDYIVHGCAWVSPYTPRDNHCVIQMLKDSPDWLVAHEFKHCFGFIHDGK